MRFLLDEMLPATIAQQLRKRGVDAVAVVEEPELTGAPDDAVLESAARDGRIVVTCNIVDFLHLDRDWAADGRAHAGLLRVSSARFPQDAARVGAIINALARRARAGAAVMSVEFLQ